MCGATGGSAKTIVGETDKLYCSYCAMLWGGSPSCLQLVPSIFKRHTEIITAAE